MQRLLFLFPAVLPLTLIGCAKFEERDWGEFGSYDTASPYYEGDYAEGYSGYGYYSVPLDVLAPDLTGAMGDVANPGERTWGQGTLDSTYAYIDIHAEGEVGAMMAVLTVGGGLDHPDFQPGASRTYNSQSYSAETYVNVLGCSGPTDGSWDFDQTAEEVDIIVEEGAAPGTVRFGFSATFRPYGYDENGYYVELGTTQTVTGSFEYERGALEAGTENTF